MPDPRTPRRLRVALATGALASSAPFVGLLVAEALEQAGLRTPIAPWIVGALIAAALIAARVAARASGQRTGAAVALAFLATAPLVWIGADIVVSDELNPPDPNQYCGQGAMIGMFAPLGFAFVGTLGGLVGCALTSRPRPWLSASLRASSVLFLLGASLLVAWGLGRGATYPAPDLGWTVCALVGVLLGCVLARRRSRVDATDAGDRRLALDALTCTTVALAGAPLFAAWLHMVGYAG